MNFQLKMRVDKIEENLGKFWCLFLLKKLSFDLDLMKKIYKLAVQKKSIIKFDGIKLAHKPI